VQQLKGPIAADQIYEISEGDPNLKPIRVRKTASTVKK
jgi:hypothetical protein